MVPSESPLNSTWHRFVDLLSTKPDVWLSDWNLDLHMTLDLSEGHQFPKPGNFSQKYKTNKIFSNRIIFYFIFYFILNFYEILSYSILLKALSFNILQRNTSQYQICLSNSVLLTCLNTKLITYLRNLQHHYRMLDCFHHGISCNFNHIVLFLWGNIFTSLYLCF